MNILGDRLQFLLVLISKLKVLGDFNGDSKADILYKDPLTGQSALWLVNNTAIASKRFTDSYNSALI